MSKSYLPIFVLFGIILVSLTSCRIDRVRILSSTNITITPTNFQQLPALQTLLSGLYTPIAPPAVTALPTATPIAPPAVTALPTATVTSVIQQIRARGYLLAGVAYDLPPFGYRDEKGKPIGFEIDLISEFAKRWLGDSEKVQFIEVNSSNRINALANKQVDIIAAAMSHTKENEKMIDFSQTYFLDGQNILVRADSGIHGIADLKGKKIAAIEGSNSISQIRDFAIANGLVKENPETGDSEADIQIVPYKVLTEAIQPLLKGDVDALTIGEAILTTVKQMHPRLVILLPDNFSKEFYRLGIRSGDSYFAKLVNFTLQELKEEGVYDHLYYKWFGNHTPFKINTIPYPIELLHGDLYTFSNSPTPFGSIFDLNMHLVK